MKQIPILFFSFFLFFNAFSQKDSKTQFPLEKTSISGLSFRSIGPAITGGRIIDIEVNPVDPSQYFIAAGHGNLWKTDNKGITFYPIFDNQNSHSIGAVTLDPSNPNIVWVGTGENNAQSNVLPGDGVYKSEDGGKTWKNMGLKNSEQIGEVIVHPENSNIIWVAAYGSHRQSGGERGIYKSTDGGKTWKQSLKISDHTGCWQLHLDPRDPDILYAVAHQRQRYEYTIISGGDESGIYKTTDGGNTWNKLKGGLPQKDVGRIGMDISPVNPDVLYAVVHAKKNKGIYKSTDRGASWTKQSSYETAYPFYLQNIVCDPKNIDRLYALDIVNKVSIDGGKSWKTLGEDKKHVDNHAFWIDPDNTLHLLSGCDGGLYESYDRGKNWNFKSNIPIAEIYKVTTDNNKPFYNIYIGTQDNNSLGGPSRTINSGGITNSDWKFTWGGDGFQSRVDWKDPNIIYSQSQFGGLVRFNKKTGERLYIKSFEHRDSAYRFDWDAPLIISKFDHKRLYHGCQKVLRSDDQGNTWKEISSDLTRGIPKEMAKLMGRSWSIDELASKRSLAQLSTITESPLDENKLFVGSADGLIHYTDDGGKNWHKSKLSGIPKYARINQIYASNHDKNVAYAAIQDHFGGNYKPFLYKTTDGGATWFNINANLPEKGCTYTIAEDHINSNLLFTGTMYGVFVSNTADIHWVKMTSGIPNATVMDLTIQKSEDALVVSTFGRGVYILDDYSPLRKITADFLDQKAAIFPVKDALMFVQADPYGFPGVGFQGASFYAASNPEVGAVFTYYIKEKPKTLKELRREKEKKLQKENKDVKYPSYAELEKEGNEESAFLLFTITDDTGNIIRKIKKSFSEGIHRLVWDFRFSPVEPIKTSSGGEKMPWDSPELGYMVSPGKYLVSLSQYKDGEFTELVAPQPFVCKPLYAQEINEKDQKALSAFNKKVADFAKTVAAANAHRQYLQERLPYLKKAVINTPGFNKTWFKDISAIKKQLRKVNRLINGDRLLSRYEGASRQSLKGKIDLVTSSLWSTTSLQTSTYQRAYDEAFADFDPVITELKKAEDMVKKLEDSLIKAGSPYIPGSFPIWK
jgi:photosystem II stability/assembly factor-like uncharacterized protein